MDVLDRKVELLLSTGLMLEYEAVLLRPRVLGMIGLVIADRWDALNEKYSAYAAESLALVWAGAVIWLTPAFSIPQAVVRGFSNASRLRKANDVNADLVFSDVPGRVAKALLDLADRFGRTADDGVHVHHDLTQEELAQLVGASRETVNKALADFASRGWLRLEPRSVVIMEVERLQRRAR